MRYGTARWELTLESAGAARGEILDEGAVAQTEARGGRVFQRGAVGGYLSANHGWNRVEPPFTGIGAGVYGRVGASRGLHLELGVSLQVPVQGGGGEVNPTAFMGLNIPVLRHSVVELDAVGRVWASGGEGSLAVIGLVELRARFKRHFIVGAGLHFRSFGVSMGVEL